MIKTPTVLSSYTVLLLASTMLAHAMPAQAIAQDTPEQDSQARPAKKGKAKAEEIVVTARPGAASRRDRLGEGASRDMLEESYEENVEDILDALGGISTLDGDEEGNLFSFQGMAPEMNQLTLGGQKQGRGGPRLGDMPTDMIESIQVIKSPMASMEEGASGGTVNIELRSPANLKKQIAGMRSGLAKSGGTDHLDPSLSSYFGRTFNDRKIGLMVNMAYRNSHSKTDTLATKSWDERSIDGHDGLLWVPKTVNSAVSKDGNELFSGAVVLGFRPSQALDISLKANVAETTRSRAYTSLQGMFSKQRELEALALDGDVVTELLSGDKKRSNLRIQTTDRETKDFSQSYSLDIKWQKSGTRLSASAGYSHSDISYAAPSPTMNFSKNAEFGYRLIPSDNLPSLFVGSGDIEATDFRSRTISFSDNLTATSDQYGELNLDKQVKNDFFRRFKMGVKYRRNTHDRSQHKGKYSFDEQLYLDTTDGEFIADNFLGYLDDGPLLHSWPYAAISDIIEADSITPAFMNPNLSSTFDVTQSTYGAYMQGDFRFLVKEGSPIFGNLGLRYVSTDSLSHGHQETNGEIVAVEGSSKYDDLLPSVSITARLKRRFILQLGMSRVITRPRLDMLSPSLRLNESEETGSSGNSQLQPFRANQVMADLTWVQNRQSKFTLSAAYKDVDSFFVRHYSLKVIDDTSYLVANPINGHDASILSFNLAATQRLNRLSRKLADFTFKASFTYNKSRTNFIDPVSQKHLMMPQITPKVAKLTLSYSKDKISGNIRYQWQSKSLRTPSSLSGLPGWMQAYGSVSIGANYKITDNARLSFSVRNLMNAAKVEHLGSPLQFSKLQQRGRRMSLGLKATF